MATSEYRAIFDARGGRYNHANRLFPEARAEEASHILAHLSLSDGVRWLDVGAGGGFLAGRAAASGLRTSPVGCDASPVFLFEADGYGLKAAVDYERLPFGDAAFEAAGCLAVIHHAEAPEKVIREMLRVTAAGRRVAVGDVVAGSRAERFLNEFVDAYTAQGHVGRFYDAAGAARLMEKAGGKQIRSEAVELSWRFAQRPDARAFCRELFGLLEETPDAELDAALAGLGLTESRNEFRLPWDMVFSSAVA